jgi:hypothetical protein
VAGNPQPGKFRSKNKDNPGDTFDSTSHNDVANFQNSLRGIAEYLHTTYCAHIADAILKMTMVDIKIPKIP